MIFETTKPNKYDTDLIKRRLKDIRKNITQLNKMGFDFQSIQMVKRWIEINLDGIQSVIDLNKQEFDEGIALSKASDEEP